MRLGVAAFTAALLLSWAVPARSEGGDAAILKELRPEQRQYVILADRDGTRRVLAYTPLAPAPAIARAAPRPRLVVARSPRAFVPTVPVAKPIAQSTPRAIVRDLAWVYAHRFDTPPPDSIPIPGELVRSQIGSPFDINSGAFHGVRAVNGWSAVRVAVSIPCGARRFSKGPGYNEVTQRDGIVDAETGYINVGGWGAGRNGTPVDAGLQKSSAQAEHDDYALYWKYAQNKPLTSTLRFACGGPDVVMELYPVADHLLVFSATGELAHGRRVTLTVVQRTRPSDGWLPGGGTKDDGIILKRIVAIAQPRAWHRPWSFLFGGNHLDDGSYFGVHGPHDPTPRIVFRSCELGRVVPPAIVPQYHAWTGAQTWAPSPGTYLDWPPSDIIKGLSGACDAVGIYLHGA